jgi:ribosomal protein S18 acetylase RimI-like enzyme
MFVVRYPLISDEEVWKRLWANYNLFYNATVSDAITAYTWHRILDPESPIFARLAIRHDQVIGFCVCVIHEGTWTISPICYLEDLFVDPDSRRVGAGRALIDDLIRLSRKNSWSRLYWHTQKDNVAARRLYDEFVHADQFVRYRLFLEQSSEIV